MIIGSCRASRRYALHHWQRRLANIPCCAMMIAPSPRIGASQGQPLYKEAEMYSELNTIVGLLRDAIRAPQWQTNLARNPGLGHGLAACYSSLLDIILWTERLSDTFSRVAHEADSHDGPEGRQSRIWGFCRGAEWLLLGGSLSQLAAALRQSQAAAKLGGQEVAAQFADLTDPVILEAETLAVPLLAGNIPLREGKLVHVEENLDAEQVRQIRTLVDANVPGTTLAALEECARQLRELLIQHSIMLEVTHEDSVISFPVREGRERPWWRYLDIHDRAIYLIGNMCDTCKALFELKRNAQLPLAPEALAESFRTGLPRIATGRIIETVKAIMPKGDYVVGLLEITPRPISPSSFLGDTPRHYHWSQYDRVTHAGILTVQELILPLVSGRRLRGRRVGWYKREIKRGTRPAALALSLVDTRCISGRQIDWKLVHFLLDGHHKVMAAADLHQPLTLLSFLSFTESFAGDHRYLTETLMVRYGRGTWPRRVAATSGADTPQSHELRVVPSSYSLGNAPESRISVS